MSKVEIAPTSFATIFLHCRKYPEKGVSGLLVGSKKGDKVTVTNVVPVTHESTPLAPTLQLVSTLVQAKFGEKSIVGAYFANENVKDHSLNPYITRLVDKISSVSGISAVLIQVLNDRLLAENEDETINAYERNGEQWKKIGTTFNQAQNIESLNQKKLHRELIDFENHLDNPETDFFNTKLLHLVSEYQELAN